MKSLNIKSEQAILTKNVVGVEINDKYIDDLLKENLPQLEDFKKYPIELCLNIKFLGEEGLKIDATGYKIKPQEEKNNE